MEHTHLVRGLDYALLRKIRNQEKEQNEIEVEDNLKTTDDKKDSSYRNNDISSTKSVTVGKKADVFKDFRTSSVMAENLKNMLLNPESTLFIQKIVSYAVFVLLIYLIYIGLISLVLLQYSLKAVAHSVIFLHYFFYHFYPEGDGKGFMIHSIIVSISIGNNQSRECSGKYYITHSI